MIGFWLRWVVLTTVGLVVGFMGSFMAIDAVLGPEGPEAIGVPFEVAFPVVIGVAGTLIGALQWLQLRRRAARTAGWIPATGLGLLIALLVIVRLPEGSTLPGVVLWGALHALVVGLAVGSLQWLAIRHLDPARTWLWASLVAWLVAGITGDILAFYSGDGGLGTMLIFFGWAALTAPVLHRLLHRTHRQQTSPTGTATPSPGLP
jgi:hypothetical protein